MRDELAAIAVEALTGNLTMNDVEPDVLAAWNDFWRDVVCEDGRLNVAQVARELSDFSAVMHEVSLVYDDVTMGMLSKPNTAHQHVIDRVNELEQDHIDEAVKEAVSDAESDLAAALKLNQQSICIFCGETVARDPAVMLEHAEGCEKRPENRLMAKIATLESDLAAAHTAAEYDPEDGLSFADWLTALIDAHVESFQAACMWASEADNNLAAALAAKEEAEEERDRMKVRVRDAETIIAAVCVGHGGSFIVSEHVMREVPSRAVYIRVDDPETGAMTVHLTFLDPREEPRHDA
jgi:hypothetical protein